MIDPITGAAVADALAAITAGMSGQSLSDAYDERMNKFIDVEDGPSIGYGDWTSDKPSISGNTGESISDGTGATPVDAWHDYVENEPFVTVSDTTGGAVSGSNVFTFAYSLMEENPGTAQAVVKAVAPVAIPIGTAVVAISQALGVSMNYSEVSDEIKNSLASAIESVGGIYDEARGLVTAWKDELGRILFPKKALDAVSDTIDELGIGDTEVGGEVDYSGVNKSLLTDPNWSPTLYALPPVIVTISASHPTNPNWRDTLTSNADCCIRIDPGSSYYFVSTHPFTVSRDLYPYTHNAAAITSHDVTYYYDLAYSSFSDPIADYPMSNISGRHSAWDIAYLILNGTGWQGGSGYPDGTSKSEASSYTPSTIPVAGNIATSYDPDTGVLGTEPIVPIHIPDDPTDTTGDTTDPIDPTDDENTEVTAPPLPLPIPDTKPSNPDVPLVNPSIVDSTLVNELVEELANTLDPQAPQSSGLIPVPPLPGIGDPSVFPSIIPTSGPGFIHVYNPTPAEFVAFGTWLWVTYADATIDKILNNPFDGVIGAHELYATPNRDGRDNIRSAFLTCPTSADLVTNRYSEIDCGTVIVPEFYGNYLDYSPYSQAYIYLPFIGINEVGQRRFL